MMNVHRKTPTCIHSHTVIDVHTATVICVNCAFVIEDIIGSDQNISIHNTIRYDENNTTTKGDEQYLFDICENAHIPTYTIELVMTLFNTFLLRKKTIPFSRRNILIFSLYEVLGEEKILYPPLYLTKYTGISIIILCKMEGLLSTSIKDQSAHLMINRFCALLSIERKHSMNIEKITENFSKIITNIVQPQCQCAVVLYLYCSEFNLKYTLKDISVTCWVTPPTVHRIIRQLEKKYVKQISLLCTFPYYCETLIE